MILIPFKILYQSRLKVQSYFKNINIYYKFRKYNVAVIHYKFYTVTETMNVLFILQIVL